jgi:hypothetical protein
MTSGLPPLSPFLYIDKYLFWFLNMKDVYLPSEIWDVIESLPPADQLKISATDQTQTFDVRTYRPIS